MSTKVKILPERHGKKWEDDEIAYILNRVQRNANYITIAGEVKRTHSSIRQQIKNIACKMIDDGKSKEEVSEVTRLTIADIDETLQLRELSKEMKRIKETRPPPPPLPKPIRPFFLARPEDEKENAIELLVEIRNLLRQLVDKP
jgi:hypothetical protein